MPCFPYAMLDVDFLEGLLVCVCVKAWVSSWKVVVVPEIDRRLVPDVSFGYGCCKGFKDIFELKTS